MKINLSEKSEASISGRRLLALAALSSVLQYLSFFPANLGFLGWIALVPFLVLAKVAVERRAGWLVWGVCFCQFLASLRWMMVADERMIATWILLAWWCSLFPWFAWRLLRLLDARTGLPLTFTVGLVWLPLEHARAYLLTGFPWYYLAHTQHDVLPLLQTADFAGTQYLSLLVAVCNGWLADLLCCWGAQSATKVSINHPVRRSVLAVGGVVFLGLFCFGWGYGVWRLNQVAESLSRGPLVVAMQASHPQSARNDAAYFNAIWEDYKILLSRAKRFEPDLIIWPETSFPFELPVSFGTEGPLLGQKRNPEAAENTQVDREFSGPAQLLGSGVVVVKDGKPHKRHNASLLQDFKRGIVRRYDKIHRVPFGEYLPLKGIIPGMDLLSPYEFDYSISAGEGFPRFPLTGKDGREYTFSTLICFEDSDFSLARLAAGADGQEPPDFLVNQSNDGWFKGTEEHEQHLAVARFRSVETRKSLIRSVNMGVSALVDPAGRVLEPTTVEGIVDGYRVGMESEPLAAGRWKEFKAKPILLGAEIPLSSMNAPYVQWGDWVAWSFDLALVLFIGISLWRKRFGKTPSGKAGPRAMVFGQPRFDGSAS